MPLAMAAMAAGMNLSRVSATPIPMAAGIANASCSLNLAPSASDASRNSPRLICQRNTMPSPRIGMSR